jgi:hypothetical protein
LNKDQEDKDLIIEEEEETEEEAIEEVDLIIEIIEITGTIGTTEITEIIEIIEEEITEEIIIEIEKIDQPETMTGQQEITIEKIEEITEIIGTTTEELQEDNTIEILTEEDKIMTDNQEDKIDMRKELKKEENNLEKEDHQFNGPKSNKLVQEIKNLTLLLKYLIFNI